MRMRMVLHVPLMIAEDNHHETVLGEWPSCMYQHSWLHNYITILLQVCSEHWYTENSDLQQLANHEWSSVTHCDTAGYSKNSSNFTGFWHLKQLPVFHSPASQAVGHCHFNCTSLKGVEVENQDGPGTALSHWEKRILEVKQLITTSY